jgi:hypothetical protein
MPKLKHDEPAYVRTLRNAVDTVHFVTDCPPEVLAVSKDTRAELVTKVDAAIRDLKAIRRTLAATPRTCEVCGADFLGRADARYCGDAHRQQAHRGTDHRYVKVKMEPFVTECGVDVTPTGEGRIPVYNAAQARAMGIEPTAEELQRERDNGHG